MNTYAAIRQMMKTLRLLDGWLVKAEEYAKTKSFDANVLATSRLAPDMFPLVRQVQSACDAAKFCAAYTSGIAAPSHPDTETTMAELHARVTTVLAWLDGLGQDAFAGSSDRKAAPQWARGAWLPAEAYLMEAGMPNFYFHVVTAYGILRHNGVQLGKLDFLAELPLRND